MVPVTLTLHGLVRDYVVATNLIPYYISLVCCRGSSSSGGARVVVGHMFIARLLIVSGCLCLRANMLKCAGSALAFPYSALFSAEEW